MRRADRLFQIVQLVRGRRLTTAQYLATRLAVSERTIYRDVADLQLQGVPIEGEAGVGYRMQAGFDLPPLMFSRDEAQALVAALRMARSWLGPKLVRGGEGAVAKIMSVLPPDLRAAVESLPLHAPPFDLDGPTLAHLDVLQEAATRRLKARIHYLDLQGQTSERIVRPLACFYWGKVWTLATWCETRNDFRNFRLDRIQILELTGERFRDEPGKTLPDMIRIEEEKYGCELNRADGGGQ